MTQKDPLQTFLRQYQPVPPPASPDLCQQITQRLAQESLTQPSLAQGGDFACPKPNHWGSVKLALLAVGTGLVALGAVMGLQRATQRPEMASQEVEMAMMESWRMTMGQGTEGEPSWSSWEGLLD